MSYYDHATSMAYKLERWAPQLAKRCSTYHDPVGFNPIPAIWQAMRSFSSLLRPWQHRKR